MSEHNTNTSDRQETRPPSGKRRGPMGGGPPGMMPGEKPKNFKGTMKKLIQHLKPFYGKIIIVLAFSIISTIFAIQTPKIMGEATDGIVKGMLAKSAGTGGIDFGYIGGIVLILIGCYLASAAFMFVQGFIMNGVSQKISYNFRREMFAKLNKLPLKYFDTKTHGEILSRVTNDIDTLGQTLGQSMSQIVTAVTTLIGTLVMMLTISGSMTITAVLIVPVSMIFVMAIVKMSQKHYKKQQEFLGHVNGQVEEIYGCHNIVKAFNAEEKEIEKFDELNEKLYQSSWKAQAYSGAMMPIMNFIGTLGYVVVVIQGCFLAIRGTISIGNIQSFTQYVRNFTQPITQTAQIANILQSTAAAAERVFEFLAEIEEQPEAENPVSTENIAGTVEFKSIHFGYDPEKIIINDFSATISPGQRIAIVGPTGAGKTTIVKLLMRFYELNGGAISIDGSNINLFSRNGLRSMVGMVLQDTWLFNGSIMENIRYGRLDATDEEVVAAGKSAHIDHFVRTLPNTYHAELNEEASNISQGQKQLLTIARAILADPKILILDEATSSVDTRTEVRIQKAMNNLMRGRTSFIIAHRLSTIRDADLIIVMNDGDIVEQGTHNALLEADGFYAELYNSQFESGLVS